MALETWVAFALAAQVVLLIPGPTILLVVAYSLSHGRMATVPLVIGVGLGDLTAMVFSFVGLGVLLQTVAAFFAVFKWAGAAYLVYLGIQLWRTPPQPLELSEIDTASQSQRTMLRHTWVTTALNPKSIVFFLAFVPQFLDPQAEFLPQILLFGGTFLGFALLNAFGYAWLASRLRNQFRNPTTQQRLNRVGGSLLIGAGGLALLPDS